MLAFFGQTAPTTHVNGRGQPENSLSLAEFSTALVYLAEHCGASHATLAHRIAVANVAIGFGIADKNIVRACLLLEPSLASLVDGDVFASCFGAATTALVRQVLHFKNASRQEQLASAAHLVHNARTVLLCDLLQRLSTMLDRDGGATPEAVRAIQGTCVFSSLLAAALAGTHAELEARLCDEIFAAYFVRNGEAYPCCPEGLDHALVLADTAE